MPSPVPCLSPVPAVAGAPAARSSPPHLSPPTSSPPATAFSCPGDFALGPPSRGSKLSPLPRAGAGDPASPAFLPAACLALPHFPAYPPPLPPMAPSRPQTADPDFPPPPGRRRRQQRLKKRDLSSLSSRST
ncbi:hypothetical protein VPH35_114093 [Triticum aestivum]